MCYTSVLMGVATGPDDERNLPVSPKRRPTSLTFRLRLAKVFQELDAAVRDAQEHAWQQLDLDRASEMALALAGACRVEGMKEASSMARSLG